MVLNREKIKQFRREMEKKLNEYAKEKGVQITIGHIKYDNTSFVAKVKVVLAGNQEEAERLEFEKDSSLFGLKKEDYGKEIKLSNMGKIVEYTLIGLSPKSSKYPLIVRKKGDIRTFKLRINKTVRKQLGIDDSYAIYEAEE